MDRTIYECDADEFPSMTLADAIKWLQGIADQQPCPPEQVSFLVTQMGDRWDGYSLAKVEIVRPETAEETVAREQAEAASLAERRAQQEASERAAYEALKQKYG